MAIMPAQKPGRSRQDYCTPQDFLAAVLRRLDIREFAIDLAADAENTVADLHLDVALDALSVHNWALYTRSGGWGWLNPPFADITPWAERCAATRRAGGQVAFLTPASVGANWFRDFVDGQALVLALNGRLAFIPEEPASLYPKDCLLSLYSPVIQPGFEVWSWRCTQDPRRIIDVARS